MLLLAAGRVAMGQIDHEAMERERMRANGVEYCTQFTHKYHKGQAAPEGYKACETRYNREGKPLEVTNYRANGKVSSKLFFEYDGQGRRVSYRKEEPVDGKQMKVSFLQRFTYDQRGNKRSETGYDGSARYRVVYSYLPNGKLANITRYNADNSVAERWIYSYSGDKQLISVTPKSGVPYQMEKVFGRGGELLSETTFDGAGKEQKKVEYAYGRGGRKEQERQSYGGQLSSTQEYHYNAKGQLEKVFLQKPKQRRFVNNGYVYDPSGQLIKEEWAEGNPDQMSSRVTEYKSGNVVRVESYYAPYRYRVMYTYEYRKF
ncbi:MAG: hypothetical protein CSA07_01620 [Bacteroidia bacterium]|nr:MAG: hypothetical protein CSA07_01620 [Bacteroidia bacterium]